MPVRHARSGPFMTPGEARVDEKGVARPPRLGSTLSVEIHVVIAG
jgi:hypothetical protein